MNFINMNYDKMHIMQHDFLKAEQENLIPSTHSIQCISKHLSQGPPRICYLPVKVKL